MPIPSTISFPYFLPYFQHTLKILAVDGSDVEAETAESVILHSAERFDVEIQTEAPVGNYWVRLEDMASKDTNEVNNYKNVVLFLNYFILLDELFKYLVF